MSKLTGSRQRYYKISGLTFLAHPVQPVYTFSVISKCMTLTAPEFHVNICT